jgi:Tfp pilus assembly protein PilF
MGDKERRETLIRIRQLLDTGQVEKARQDILAYLKRESTAEGFYLAGLIYMRQGDVNSAYRNFKEAIRLKPDFYEAQQKLAEIYVTVGT